MCIEYGLCVLYVWLCAMGLLPTACLGLGPRPKLDAE